MTDEMTRAPLPSLLGELRAQPLAAAATAAGLAAASWAPARPDGDFWFMEASGRAIMEGGLYQAEPLSMHEMASFQFQKWLSYLISAGAWATGGELAVRLLVSAGSLAIALLLCGWLRERGCSPWARAIGVAAWAYLAMFFRVSRPQLFTYAAMAAELWAIERVGQGRSGPRLLFALPALVVVEMQIHTTQWPVLVMVAGPYVVGWAIDARAGRAERPWRELALATLAIFPATLLNPYGLSGATYIFRSLGHEYMGEILECSLTISWFTDLPCMVMTGSWIVIRLRDGRLAPAEAVSAVMWLAFIYMGTRNCGYLYLYDAMLAADITEPFCERPRAGGAPVLACALVAGLVAAAAWATGVKEWADDMRSDTPTACFSYVAQESPGSDVFCGFSEGSYAIKAGLAPYIDPRAEVYFECINNTHDWFTEYFDAFYDPSLLQQILDGYGLDYAVVSSDSPFAGQLEKEGLGFERTFVDTEHNYEVWERAG